MIVNRQIGGSGGGESASIFVQGLASTDTVSCTKDGKSYSGRWVSKEVQTYSALIPTMTSNTTPSGVASAYDTSDSTNHPAYKAFDKDSTTLHYSNSNVVNKWIQYQFANTVTINRVTYSLAYEASSVVTGTVAGYIQTSMNGSSWNNVDSFSFTNDKTTHHFDNEITATQAKYIRIYYTSLPIYENRYRIEAEYEIQAYGITTTTVSGWQFDNLKSYGTYTITSGSKTQNVLVDFATEFDISL